MSPDAGKSVRLRGHGLLRLHKRATEGKPGDTAGPVTPGDKLDPPQGNSATFPGTPSLQGRSGGAKCQLQAHDGLSKHYLQLLSSLLIWVGLSMLEAAKRLYTRRHKQQGQVRLLNSLNAACRHHREQARRPAAEQGDQRKQHRGSGASACDALREGSTAEHWELVRGSSCRPGSSKNQKAATALAEQVCGSS